jgi:D-lactate dehydrogenase
VDKVLKNGEVVTFKKGDIVFREGDPAGWFYVLLQGAVTLRKHDTNVRSLAVGELGGVTSALSPPGEETSLKRSMTHVAVSDDVVILKLSHSLYRELLDDHDFAVHAVSYLHMRIRAKTNVISLLTSQPGEATDLTPKEGDIRIAFYDAKPYDKEYFDAELKARSKSGGRVSLKYVTAKLSIDTVTAAIGCQAVCIFVNDCCDSAVVQRLASIGIDLILLRCAGFNQVDLKAAKSAQMTVLRVPAYSPNAVAEHAFALLATVNRKTNRAYNRVRDGNFMLHGLVGRDLKGLTAGVAGCGKIGECFVNIAKGCGMKVVVWDKFLKPEKAKELGVEQVEEINDLFKRSDVISLHLPLTDETKHLVNAERLKMMPKNAIVINTSRGPIVDAAALIDALVKGTLRGAGLDVYEEEKDYFFEDCSDKPIKDPILARLVNLPNCVVTSHQAFLTDKALTAIAQITLDNAKLFQDGKKSGRGVDAKGPTVVIAGHGKASKL